MNRRAIFDLFTRGESLPSAEIAKYKLPAVAAANADYITAKYTPDGKLFLTLTALPVTVANTTGASFGSKQLLDFAETREFLQGGTHSLSFNWAGSGISATGSGDYSIGTTATADATLSGTDVDIMASTAMVDPAVASITTGKGPTVNTTAFDGTTTAKDAFLNVIIDDAAVADANTSTVYVTGTITLHLRELGDY